MAPRGRPRKRNNRIDAAIDAMKQFGFSEKLIRAKVKELLNEYGGDDGWVFIEDCAYKVLLDVCLEANTDEENADEGNSLQAIQTTTQTMDLQRMDQVCGQEEADMAVSNIKGTSALASVPEMILDVTSPASVAEKILDVLSPASLAEKIPQVMSPASLAEKILDVTSPASLAEKIPVVFSPASLAEKIPDVMSPAWVPCPRPVNNNPNRRPCYGWIDSDEDQEDINDFILLLPLPPGLTTESASGELEQMDSGTSQKIKRKSRWDLTPEVH